jgi:hypothetical protein
VLRSSAQLVHLVALQNADRLRCGDERARTIHRLHPEGTPRVLNVTSPFCSVIRGMSTVNVRTTASTAFCRVTVTSSPNGVGILLISVSASAI